MLSRVISKFTLKRPRVADSRVLAGDELSLYWSGKSRTKEDTFVGCPIHISSTCFVPESGEAPPASFSAADKAMEAGGSLTDPEYPGASNAIQILIQSHVPEAKAKSSPLAI